RDPPRERRRLDAAVAVGGGLANLANLVPRLRRRTRFGLFRHLGRFLRRYLLALLADPGDGAADRRLAFRHRDLEQHAAEVGLDLLRHLVGVHLEQRLALPHALALRLEPARDRPRLHALAQPWQLHLV